jgi:hypothetical protein
VQPLKVAKKLSAIITRAGCIAAIEKLARHHEPQTRPLRYFDANRKLLNMPRKSAPLKSSRNNRKGH